MNLVRLISTSMPRLADKATANAAAKSLTEQRSTPPTTTTLARPSVQTTVASTGTQLDAAEPVLLVQRMTPPGGVGHAPFLAVQEPTVMLAQRLPTIGASQPHRATNFAPDLAEVGRNRLGHRRRPGKRAHRCGRGHAPPRAGSRSADALAAARARAGPSPGRGRGRGVSARPRRTLRVLT